MAPLLPNATVTESADDTFAWKFTLEVSGGVVLDPAGNTVRKPPFVEPAAVTTSDTAVAVTGTPDDPPTPVIWTSMYLFGFGADIWSLVDGKDEQ